MNFIGHSSINFYYLGLITSLYLFELIFREKDQNKLIILSLISSLVFASIVLDHFGWSYLTLLIDGFYFCIKIIILLKEKDFSKKYFKSILAIFGCLVIAFFLSSFFSLGILLLQPWTLLMQYSKWTPYTYPFLVISLKNKYFLGLFFIIAYFTSCIFILKKQIKEYFPILFSTFFLIFLVLFAHYDFLSLIIPYIKG